MTFRIEMLSIGSELDELIHTSASILNAAQTEFRFELPPARLRDWGKSRAQASYNTVELFSILENYREEERGNRPYRPYLIGFISSSLSSWVLTNLFGCVRSVNGLAIVTTKDSLIFAPTMQSYIVYYMVRYAINFVAINLKSHVDTRDCLFDKKINKFDLRRSMATGDLCELCRNQFAENANEEIDVAVTAMAREVARLSFAGSAALIASRPDRSTRREKLASDGDSRRASKWRLFYSYSEVDGAP